MNNGTEAETVNGDAAVATTTRSRGSVHQRVILIPADTKPKPKDIVVGREAGEITLADMFAVTAKRQAAKKNLGEAPTPTAQTVAAVVETETALVPTIDIPTLDGAVVDTGPEEEGGATALVPVVAAPTPTAQTAACQSNSSGSLTWKQAKLEAKKLALVAMGCFLGAWALFVYWVWFAPWANQSGPIVDFLNLGVGLLAASTCIGALMAWFNGLGIDKAGRSGFKSPPTAAELHDRSVRIKSAMKSAAMGYASACFISAILAVFVQGDLLFTSCIQVLWIVGVMLSVNTRNARKESQGARDPKLMAPWLRFLVNISPVLLLTLLFATVALVWCTVLWMMQGPGKPPTAFGNWGGWNSFWEPTTLFPTVIVAWGFGGLIPLLIWWRNGGALKNWWTLGELAFPIVVTVLLTALECVIAFGGGTWVQNLPAFARFSDSHKTFVALWTKGWASPVEMAITGFACWWAIQGRNKQQLETV
jgi:hypothetical protein